MGSLSFVVLGLVALAIEIYFRNMEMSVSKTDRLKLLGTEQGFGCAVIPHWVWFPFFFSSGKYSRITMHLRVVFGGNPNKACFGAQW